MANAAKGYYTWAGRQIIGKVYGDVPTPGLPAKRSLLDLNDTMLHGDVMSRAMAADDIAEFKEYYDKTWKVRIFDFLWREVGELGDDLMELVGTDPRNNVPTCTLKIKGGSEYVQTFMKCQTTLVGITVETGGLRMAYYVDSFDWEYNNSEWVGTANLLGIWDILNYLQIWPNWLLPIQTQIPGQAIFLGPIRSAIAGMIGECALRLQLGLWEWINNMLSGNLDIRAWFGTLILSQGRDKLRTPIYISPVDIWHDGSPLIARTVRMESCANVIKDVTRAYGVTVHIDLWLPGDEQPDDYTKSGAVRPLNQPTYVVKIIDRSQIVGPTGTVLDSVIRTVVDFLGSFFGDIAGVIRSVRGMSGRFTSPLLGVNYVPPWAIVIAPEPGEKGSVASCKLSFHTPKGWQHIIGGRCVSGETLVHTDQGLLEAKTLDGTEVMVLSQGGVYRPARWQSYGEQQLFKVAFTNGDEIFATAQHQWLVDGETRWVSTLDLAGEYVPFYGHPGIGAVRVDSVEPTDRIELVYCCEEPETNTWVAGAGYLTGNSPKWLNDLFNFIFGWIIDAISILLGFIGIPSSLLDGFLNNAFLAFQLIEHFTRRSQVGPYHPAMEVMHPTASAPYNVESMFAFINAMWDSRGYVSGQFMFRDGDVYKLGVDIFKGGLISLLYDNRKQIFTDYIENILFRYTPDVRDVMVQVGDGKQEESPLAKHQRFISGVLETVNILTLAPQA